MFLVRERSRVQLRTAGLAAVAEVTLELCTAGKMSKPSKFRRKLKILNVKAA